MFASGILVLLINAAHTHTFYLAVASRDWTNGDPGWVGLLNNTLAYKPKSEPCGVLRILLVLLPLQLLSYSLLMILQFRLTLRSARCQLAILGGKTDLSKPITAPPFAAYPQLSHSDPDMSACGHCCCLANGCGQSTTCGASWICFHCMWMNCPLISTPLVACN